jgi:hypothetical protein
MSGNTTDENFSSLWISKEAQELGGCSVPEKLFPRENV